MFIVRQNGHQAIYGFCRECKNEVEMLTLDSAVTRTSKSTREIFQMIERGAIHSVEENTGHLLVCRVSLEESRSKISPKKLRET